jgi:hypothetical protein
MTAQEMVHWTGDNGPGWLVPREKPWAELSYEEQADRVVKACDISCPSWCAEHQFGCGSPDVTVISHLWDVTPGGDFAMYVRQVDTLSDEGDLVERDAAVVTLLADEDGGPQAEIRAEVTRVTGIAPTHEDGWGLDAADAEAFTAAVRPLPAEWAAQLADALETVVRRIREPRRHRVRMFYGRGVA